MYYSLKIQQWNTYLELLDKKYSIYAPFKEREFIDFKRVKDNFNDIIYNSPKTLTPMSYFLYPFKENVTHSPYEKNIIPKTKETVILNINAITTILTVTI